MKKRWVLLIILPVIILSLPYLLVPGSITVTVSGTANANMEGTFRTIVQDTAIRKWWPAGPENKETEGQVLAFRQLHFQQTSLFYQSLEFNTWEKKDTVQSNLYFIPLNSDSIRLEWRAGFTTGNNPLSRLRSFLFARKLSSVFKVVTDTLIKYINQPSSIYGIGIKKERVPFQHFISLKQQLDHYPTTEEIYRLITELRSYASGKTDYLRYAPILHVDTKDSITYQLQLALATDSLLPGNGRIDYKWMMKDGNILVADVTGGPGVINEGFQKMRMYISDYRLNIIALPFQMMITDRLKEPDSTKWITRLYYPVM